MLRFVCKDYLQYIVVMLLANWLEGMGPLNWFQLRSLKKQQDKYENKRAGKFYKKFSASNKIKKEVYF